MDADREQRRQLLLAYFMDELEGEERRRAESEIAREPEEAERCRKLIDELRAWASEPVDAPPLRLEDLPLEGTPDFAVDRGWSGARAGLRFAQVGRWAWAMAAAALLIFALSQVSFTLQVGNVALHWDSPSPVSLAALGSLQEQMNRIELASAAGSEQIAQVDLRQAALEEVFQQTTTQLVQLQEVEAKTRYRDMQSLMQLAAAGR